MMMRGTRAASTARTPVPLLVPLLLGVLGACGAEDAPPDVLFVSLDSVRADHLTFEDADTAPAMTRLAERGTRFRQAVSGTSWTLPAHAQMFTGNPPLIHGAQTDVIRIDPLHRTLPELLSERGYATLGFWTGWYLADEYGFARGFDQYRSSMTIDPADNRVLRDMLEQRGDSESAIRSLLEQVASHQDITSEKVVSDARAALAEVPDGRPVFLFAHFYDPHYDYIPPAPYDTRFDPDYDGSMDGVGFWYNQDVFDEATKTRRIGDRDLEHILALYRGEIAWTDRAVGQLIELFEARRGLEHTLVVITSDHGEEFFEHGNRGHRNGLFDEVLRVPLLIAPPGGGAPGVVDGQVTLSDLLPTVADYAGAEVPATVYGRSLRPWLSGGSLPERPAVSSLLLKVEQPGKEAQFWLTQAVRTPREKLLRTVSFHGAGRTRPRSMLRYDLVADPGETTPLDFKQKEYPALWSRMEDALDPIRAAFAALPHSSAEERATAVKERFAEDLGALGYVDAGSEADEQGRAPKPWLWSPLPRIEPPR